VNNFAHIGGFVFGLGAAVGFLPWQAFGAWDRAKKRFAAVIAIGLLVAMYATALPIFFTDQNPDCSWCHYADCIDFVPGEGLDTHSHAHTLSNSHMRAHM
jgi:hypothetical protein